MTTRFFHGTASIERLGRRLSLIILLLLSAGAMAADIEVRTDRKRVSLDESFQLIFIAREAADSEPDFSALERDFEILGQSRSSNISVVNGKFNSVTTWNLNVMARRPGVLTIPPIPFGRDRSSAASITVTAGDGGPGAVADADLFMEVEADTLRPLVQSQVIYTMRLYRRVDIARAALSEPELPDALVEKLGDDSNYTVRRDGEPFWVTERKYAIFPQKSGPMTIPALELDAQVFVDGGADPNLGGFFGRRATRARRIVSDTVTLQVLPVPAQFPGSHWLPAEELRLEERWSDHSGGLRVGEPVTRTLRLHAKGATAGQLPEIGAGSVADGLNAYSDQPRLEEHKQRDGLEAFREEKIALIPSSPGRFVVPAVEIPWWNTRTGRLEVAKLPERRLEAVAAEGVKGPPIPKRVDDGDASLQFSPPENVGAPERQAPASLWLALALIFGLGWSITALAWWRQRKRTEADPATDPVPGAKAALAEVRRACLEGDARGARRALLAWARARWPESGPVGLQAIAPRCGKAVQAELARLDRALYGGRESDWNGEALWHALRAAVAEEPKQKRRRPGRLEALHRI